VGTTSDTGQSAARTTRRAPAPTGEQGTLFDDGAGAESLPSDVGFRGTVACRAVGITYRQLDYWARTGLVEPSVRPAHGSGTQRLYNFRDILVLKIVKRLLDTGVSLQNIRAAVGHLRSRGVEDLAQVTLMSDGSSIYECTSGDEVIDLLQGGQGVFGIAVGRVWQEVRGELASLPAERVVDSGAEAGVGGEPRPGGAARAGHRSDELAARRARRTG
jgi:DNA-binding transcriptional MerR regulator